MRVNEAKLMEYVGEQNILRFDTEEAFLDHVNWEREHFYNYKYPNTFVNLEETKEFSGEHQLEYKGKYYLLIFDECLDIYEN